MRRREKECMRKLVHLKIGKIGAYSSNSKKMCSKSIKSLTNIRKIERNFIKLHAIKQKMS
jgi:hypothetical protein